MTAHKLAMREVLIGARWLISDPARWTKRSYARDRNDQPCDLKGTEACSWCAVGAIHAAAAIFTDGGKVLGGAAVASFAKTNFLFSGIGDHNDWASHAKVLTWFDNAIKALS